MSGDADADLPEIEYPIRWMYTLIGWDEVAMRTAVGGVVGNRDHTLEFSRASTKGKYCSLHLHVVVVDREDRLGTYQALGDRPEIRMVL